jgi:predicted nucleotidyltransferase
MACFHRVIYQISRRLRADGPEQGARRPSMNRERSPLPVSTCYDAFEKWYALIMRRDNAIATLKAHEDELRKIGIEHLFLFGSTARDEARDDSDVDLFFDHPEGSLGLFELMDVKEITSRILGCKADIMTRRSLHRVLRKRIEASARQVF